MAYWWPIVEASGVPAPRTVLVAAPTDLDVILDGRKPQEWESFLHTLRMAAFRVGWPDDPVFLRTGHTSGKHDWERTCYVHPMSRIVHHVVALVEHSAMADMMGLPTRTFAVREYVPLVAPFKAFRGMPVAVERRLFVRDHAVLCEHPYWPPDSIRNPDRKDWRSLLAEGETIADLNDSRGQIGELMASLVPLLDGYWSVDVALGQDANWRVIDMADGARSFHWPNCPHSESPLP
jgi:hypothetical protein